MEQLETGINRTCIMKTPAGRCAGGNLLPGQTTCQRRMPCDKSLKKYTIPREETLKFLMLHGMTQASADTLLDAIEDDNCQYLHYSGESNSVPMRGNCKYSIQQVRECCRLLQDRLNLSLRDIATKLEMRYESVRNIYYYKTWLHISRYYNFDARHSTNQEVYSHCGRNFRRESADTQNLRA